MKSEIGSQQLHCSLSRLLLLRGNYLADTLHPHLLNVFIVL